ncbi:hypothetical protein ACKZDW_05460 (plasmid) [Ralstonia syzygii subsp. celebesensis]
MKISTAAMCSIHAPSLNGSGTSAWGMAATHAAATDMRATGRHHERAGGGSSRWRGGAVSGGVDLSGDGVGQGMA